MCIVICTLLLSRPARGAWVEILETDRRKVTDRSRPARGAWVEIHAPPSKLEALAVAPRKGRVG